MTSASNKFAASGSARAKPGSRKQLTAEIKAVEDGNRLFDAKVTVLGKYVAPHVQEEERERFLESRDGDLDLNGGGEQRAARKIQLTAQVPK